VSSDVVNKTIHLDYNNFYGNGTDVTNVVKGPNATANNPEYAAAGSGNYTNKLGADAMPDDTFTNSLTENHAVRGAVQPKVGGTTSSGWSI
jgi:hypothetical protein